MIIDEMSKDLIPVKDSEKRVDWSSIVENEDGEDTGWRIQVMNGTGSVTEVMAATEMAHILDTIHTKCVEEDRNMTMTDFRQVLLELNQRTIHDCLTLSDTVHDLNKRTLTAHMISEHFSAERLAERLGVPVEHLTYGETSLADGMGMVQVLNNRGDLKRLEPTPMNPLDIQDPPSEEQ